MAFGLHPKAFLKRRCLERRKSSTYEFDLRDGPLDTKFLLEEITFRVCLNFSFSCVGGLFFWKKQKRLCLPAVIKEPTQGHWENRLHTTLRLVPSEFDFPHDATFHIRTHFGGKRKKKRFFSFFSPKPLLLRHRPPQLVASSRTSQPCHPHTIATTCSITL